MMGTKERSFGLLPSVTLEELVPPDHFYRHLEAMLDMSVVRNLVRETYADIGAPPSIRSSFSSCSWSCSLKGCAPSVNSCRWSRTGAVCAGTSATT